MGKKISELDNIALSELSETYIPAAVGTTNKKIKITDYFLLESDLDLYAPINSPKFIGVPTAPEPLKWNETGYNAQQIATVKFVKDIFDSIPNSPDLTLYALANHTHSEYAPLESPTFTGTPTVPGYAPLESPDFSGTPTVPDLSDASPDGQIANKKYVVDSIGKIKIPNDVNLNEYAKLESPDFSGTPTVPDLSDASPDGQIANKKYVDSAAEHPYIGSVPNDTLNSIIKTDIFKPNKDKDATDFKWYTIKNNIDKDEGTNISVKTGWYYSSDSQITDSNVLTINQDCNLLISVRRAFSDTSASKTLAIIVDTNVPDTITNTKEYVKNISYFDFLRRPSVMLFAFNQGSGYKYGDNIIPLKKGQRILIFSLNGDFFDYDDVKNDDDEKNSHTDNGIKINGDYLYKNFGKALKISFLT